MGRKRKIKSRKLYYYVSDNEEFDKRKLRYLLVLLLFTSILLSTSSYAWFTTNRVVSVNSLDVKVQAEGSLEISVDGSDWKSLVDMDSFSQIDNTYPNNVNQFPTYLRPVSTGGNLSNNGFLEMFLGTVSSDNDGNYTLIADSSIETSGSGDFIAFDLFFRTTEAKQLYLTSESSVIHTDNASVGAENASRVAFIIEGVVPVGSALGTIQSLSTSDINDVYIWEPNYDVHTATGVRNAKDVYGVDINTSGERQLSYDGVISSIANGILLGDANSFNYPNNFKTVVPKISTIAGNTAYQSLFMLEAGITKIRVYMWLEGQDVDCENNASIANLSFNLQFSTNPS